MSHNLNFVGPVVPHWVGGPYGGGSVTGGMPEGEYHKNVMVSDGFDSGALDAPDILACGSVSLTVYSRFSLPTQTCCRPGCWS